MLSLRVVIVPLLVLMVACDVTIGSDKLIDLGTYIGKYKVPPKIIKITKTIAVNVPVPYPVKIPHNIVVPVAKPYPVPVTKIVKVPDHSHDSHGHSHAQADDYRHALYSPSSIESYQNIKSSSSDGTSAHSNQYPQTAALSSYDSLYQGSSFDGLPQNSYSLHQQDDDTDTVTHYRQFYDQSSSSNNNNYPVYPTHTTSPPTHSTLYNAESNTANLLQDQPSKHRYNFMGIANYNPKMMFNYLQLKQAKAEDNNDQYYPYGGDIDAKASQSALTLAYPMRYGEANSNGQYHTYRVVHDL